MAHVKVRGTSVEFEAIEGQSLLNALQHAGYPISTSCGGRAICGLCRIMVTGGIEHLSAYDPREIAHLGNVAKVIGARLACQATIERDGEIEIDVPPIVDHAARKRAQMMRRNSTPRPSRNQSDAGTGRDGPEADSGRRAPPMERIEWRPRILEGTGRRGSKP